MEVIIHASRVRRWRRRTSTRVPPRRRQVLFPTRIRRRGERFRAQRDDGLFHRDDVVVPPEHRIVPLPDAHLALRRESVRRGDVGQMAARRRELVSVDVEREVALGVLEEDRAARGDKR